MKELPARTVICPHCGYDNSRYHNDDFLLHEGSILNGKYMLGKKLGKGGFGITYLGMELLLHKKVAIKEFYPNEICSRSPGSKRVRVTNEKVGTEGFLKGQDAFLKEAQTLALFDSPYIARVREYFQENDTSYIVMDFVGGTGFDQEMKRCGGRLPWKRVVSLMMGLMPELDKVHKKNLVHRDIKPPNLKIVKDEATGKEHLVLLDFGAARSFISAEVTGTYEAILTHGYAPFEQYQKRSHQGPYTDVYALCATMYHAITGTLPPAALDRLGDNAAKIVPIHDFHLDVPEAVEKVIMHGLAFKSADRQQSMRQLYDEFAAALRVNSSETVKTPSKNEQLYFSACRRMQENSKDGYEAAYSILKQIPGYKDADELADRCLKKLLNDYPVPNVIPDKSSEITPAEDRYLTGKNAMEAGTVAGYRKAMRFFLLVPGYKNADQLVEECRRKIHEMNPQQNANESDVSFRGSSSSPDYNNSSQDKKWGVGAIIWFVLATIVEWLPFINEITKKRINQQAVVIYAITGLLVTALYLWLLLKKSKTALIIILVLAGINMLFNLNSGGIQSAIIGLIGPAITYSISRKKVS